MKNIITPYQEARDSLVTFTIINCEHKDLFWKWIGHTAVIIVDRKTGQVMVLESTTLNKHTGISGVQMMPFGQWLYHYPGKVFARIPEFPISMGDGIDHDWKRRKLADAFIDIHLGTSYPDIKTWSGRMKLALAALDFRLFGVDLLTYKGDDSGIFCTQLVIMLLQYCEILSKTYNPAEYEPDDVRGFGFHGFGCGKLDKGLIDCSYGKEIRLK